MLRLLRRIAFFACVVYLISLPVSFLVGGILFARPLRERVEIDTLRRSMQDGWHIDFLTDSREVRIPVEPRVRLSGTLFGGDSWAVVVILHQSGRNRIEGLAPAYALWRAGFGVLLLDRRAHGNSDGESRPLFGGEERDLKAVLDGLLANEWCSARRIGLFGIGDGGTTCLLTAALDDRVDAVAAENPSFAASDFVGSRMSAWLGLPSTLLFAQSFLAVRGMAMIGGVDADALEIDARVLGLDAPTLIVGSGENRTLAQRTLSRLGSGAEYAELESSGGYDALVEFFRTHL